MVWYIKTSFVKIQYVYWTVILKALWILWTKRNMEKQPREIKPQPIKSIIIEMLHWASVILIHLKRKDCKRQIKPPVQKTAYENYCKFEWVYMAIFSRGLWLIQRFYTHLTIYANLLPSEKRRTVLVTPLLMFYIISILRRFSSFFL